MTGSIDLDPVAYRGKRYVAAYKFIVLHFHYMLGLENCQSLVCVFPGLCCCKGEVEGKFKNSSLISIA